MKAMESQRAAPDSDLRGARLQSRKDAVRAHMAEPITGVGGVGFLAVDDRGPVAGFRAVDVLGERMRLLPAIEIQRQAGAECGMQAIDA
jgi:hypothetical protein